MAHQTYSLALSTLCALLAFSSCLDSRNGTLLGGGVGGADDTDDTAADVNNDADIADGVESDADDADDTVELDIGDAGARDTADAGTPGDTGVDTTPVPPDGCPALPATPTVLVQEDYWVLQPKGIAAHEGVVYFGATIGYYTDPGYMPDGRVYRINAGGSGDYEELESAHTYVGRPLAIRGRTLAYYSANVQATGASSWGFTYPGIVVRELGTGVETLVGGEALGWESIRDFELLEGANVAVVQSGSPYPSGTPGSVTLYDSAEASYTVTTNADFRWMTGHGDKIAGYVYTESGGGITMAGDASAGLVALETNADFHCCRLMGASASAIFQRRGDTIEALPWDGSPATVLATGVDVDWIYAQAGDMLYWADGSDVWVLDTADPAQGGPVKIATTQTGYIDALAADRCGVYVAANNPPRLMKMAAPQ